MKNIIIRNRVRNTKYFTSQRFKNWISQEYSFLIKYVEKNAKLLDIGSMDGRVGFMMLDDLELNFKELHLTDYQDEYISHIDKLITESERDTVFCRKEDAVNLSYTEGHFDYVTAFGGVFSLLYSENYGGMPQGFNSNISRENLISNSVVDCLRVLKSGGKLILEAQKSDFNCIEAALDSKGAHLIEKTEIQAGPSAAEYYISCFLKEQY